MTKNIQEGSGWSCGWGDENGAGFGCGRGGGDGGGGGDGSGYGFGDLKMLIEGQITLKVELI